jgi:hypothetical protein
MIINLQEPRQARRWLQLLEEDADSGYRLRPDLDVDAAKLGFSLRSNALGLRGPCDPYADNVILGTSYAMGIAVNNGENWYERCLPDYGWLNLGLAVGIPEWIKLLRRYHRGRHGRIVLLYHPNIWAHCLAYERWRDSGLGLFEALHWKTALASCLWLELRRRLRRQRATRAGWHIRVLFQGQCYEIDANYCRIAAEQERAVFDRNISVLLRELATFDQVVAVRLRIRQEVVPVECRNTHLDSLVRQYDRYWDWTAQSLSSLPSCRVLHVDGFTLEHFHPRDTHWNSAGNQYFARWLTRNVLP